MMQSADVLLVEDNPNDAEMTMRALMKNNVVNSITHLSDGAQALDYLFRQGEYAGRTPGHNPKLILLDLKMPKVDGIEVLRKIKENEDLRTIPVVVLTSSNQDPDIRICYSLGVNSYVVKPVAFEAFIKAISGLGLYWLITNQPPQ